MVGRLPREEHGLILELECIWDFDCSQMYAVEHGTLD